MGGQLNLMGMNGSKVLTNPGFLTFLGLAGVGVLARNPEWLKGKSETTQNKIEKLQNDLRNLRNENPEVANWVEIVEKADLSKDAKLGKLLTEKTRKGEYWIASADLEATLQKPHGDFAEIRGDKNNLDAKKLFQVLSDCQQYEINPQKILQAKDV